MGSATGEQTRRAAENRHETANRGEDPRAGVDSGTLIDRAIFATLAVMIVALIVGLLITPREAAARPAQWERVTSTWYGPGLYGNRTACGQRYTETIRGVAHRTLPCGSRLTIRRGAVTLRVRVIDRGPYSAATFDLSARTARDLCRCVRPYTMRHHWRRGWATGRNAHG